MPRVKLDVMHDRRKARGVADVLHSSRDKAAPPAERHGRRGHGTSGAPTIRNRPWASAMRAATEVTPTGVVPVPLVHRDRQ